MQAALSLDRLVKVFGEHRAVNGLSFDVPTGSIFVIPRGRWLPSYCSDPIYRVYWGHRWRWRGWCWMVSTLPAQRCAQPMARALKSR